MTSLDNEPTPLPDNAPDEKQKRPRKRKTAADTVLDQAQELASGLNADELTHVISTTHDDATMLPPSFESAVEPAVNPNQTQEGVLATEPTPLSVPSHASGCGSQLKAAREALGLSIHEVCSQLRLGAHQIQAIEQDDFAALPQKSIVRGFIRNYARLLKIDAAPILLAYQQLIPDEAPANITVKASAYTTVINHADSPFNLKNGLSLLLIAIVLAVLAYFYVYHVQPTAAIEIPTTLSTTPETSVVSPTTNLNDAAVTAATDTPATDNAPTSAATQPQDPSNLADVVSSPALTAPTIPVAGLPNANNTPTAAAINNATAPVATLAPVTPPVATAAPAVTQVPSAKQTTVYTTTAITPTPAANTIAIANTFKANDPLKAELSFVVSEESWVRIEDAQGNRILSELLKPGAAKIMTVEKPLSIIVGHANATQLLIDQQPYDLAQATRGRVARVQLK